MKKNILLWGMIGIIFIGFLLVIIFMIYNPLNNEKQKSKVINYDEFGTYTPLELLEEDYNFEQALQDKCFIISHKQVYNMEKLNDFIENTDINSENRISDLIRIVHYTKEGNMLITDVCYKKYQNIYVVVTDNTMDKFLENEKKNRITKNDFPGNIYGIEQIDDKEYINIILKNANEQGTNLYEDYKIASYLKNAKINETGPSFVGTIEKIKDETILVKTDDVEMKEISDKYIFEIPKIQEKNQSQNQIKNQKQDSPKQQEELKLELKEGDKILVTYGGAIRNTYPAQIDVVKIQKSDESL